MSPPDDLLHGQERPTIEQVAWVFAHISNAMQEPGSYRYLIYDRMGFDTDAYGSLYITGGADITNMIWDWDKWRKQDEEKYRFEEGSK